ncbi:hotdog fold thioesterase [Mycolicibacterium neoaurum]|uniref:PaaI family thioesterase n=1 Tax=Mycolicibacterium neoaurum TaxID=1795 RepID=UPI001BCB6CCB|nr:hotdog fold thioesterase [Mycolicibacterium neoaurum]QVI29855.1 hotdog fold thioesterase [Mycolicibacterium neoaurum]
MSTQAPVDHYARHLGIVVENFDNGSATAALTVGPEHLNPHGTAHGALLFSVVGAALAAAANNSTHSGVVSSIHIDYLAPAHEGDALVASASVDERLAREDIFVVRLVNATGGTVARATGRATRRAKHSTS